MTDYTNYVARFLDLGTLTRRSGKGGMPYTHAWAIVFGHPGGAMDPDVFAVHSGFSSSEALARQQADQAMHRVDVYKRMVVPVDVVDWTTFKAAKSERTLGDAVRSWPGFREWIAAHTPL